ncbi:MAG: hypothetical protein N2C14_02395 [Planctomycetales bacterium]
MTAILSQFLVPLNFLVFPLVFLFGSVGEKRIRGKTKDSGTRQRNGARRSN